LIATELGYNIYICGNGGSVPKHAQLLIKDCPVHQVVPILDRFLMFYINTADRLQRTARWLEKLPGGMQYLKKVILEDSLGLNDALERQMQALVGTAFDEWRTVVESPEKRQLFSQFANSDKRLETVEIIQERGQSRPANWPKVNQRTLFADQEWSSSNFTPIIHKMQLRSESCAVLYGNTQLAIFRVNDSYYCTQTMCPHKRAFVLHDGILGDDGKGSFNVACPLHKRVYNLATGSCSDPSMSIATFKVEERGDGMIWIKLPPKAEIDAVLGTDLWKIQAQETENQFLMEDIIGRKKAIAVGTCGDAKLDW
jgi:nitrite reductase (NAD(P)H)